MQPSAYRDALLDSTTAGLIVFDLEGDICFANNLARSFLQHPTDQSLISSFPEIWNFTRDATVYETETLLPPMQREGRDYSATVKVVKQQDEIVGYVCALYAHSRLERLARDTKAFQDLAREESAIINFSSDGLWICDASAKVVRINPASERLNNVSAKEVIGKHMAELVAAGMLDKSVTLEVLKNKKSVSLLQKSGERSLLLTGTPVFDLQGQLIRVVVSERDVTEIDDLQRALEEEEALKNKYMEQVRSLQQAEYGGRAIIAKTPAFINLINQALKVSSVDSTVLISGESGVGKGLIADLIHENSKRKAKPMIRINCGAIPETLIESELFGYEKGAFTGAQSSKAGQFELANNGILFLDEVAELPLSAQVKLLRFLEDGCITRLGSTQRKKVDVRVLAATHRDLDAMVKAGSFRLDLYYRLKVIPLHIPALKERKDCILPLLRHHLDFFGKKVGAQKRLSVEASDILLNYEYPGNVRELINLCERLVVMTDSETISSADLPQEIMNSVEGSGWKATRWVKEKTLAETLNKVEEQVYREALKQYRNQYKVAAALGVSQATVARRVQKYGILQTSAIEDQ
ncbi:sigma 54-interacting transcriptional regulator [Geopsychrobacter electrodiphilus]|uniref:sigma 54-interacting transcriptional regulator n=1 Tax=Geopsychrobacter electrodiphilus TaxID=225196 RepID=UPI001FDF8438|nr:sigma 54-interacting transcriptional regulator [Geopsychrobacter electrodiphilus]